MQTAQEQFHSEEYQAWVELSEIHSAELYSSGGTEVDVNLLEAFVVRLGVAVQATRVVYCVARTEKLYLSTAAEARDALPVPHCRER
jgi:hypothetical protein